MEVGSLLPQKSKSLHAVGSRVQTDRSVDFAKRFPRQANIARIVFDQEDLNGLFLFHDSIHSILSFRATAVREAETYADCASTKIRPLNRPGFFPLIRLASAEAT